MKHARLSASSAHRWLVCGGSVNLSKGKDSTSFEAAQGTVAHEIAARCFRDAKHPSKSRGEVWVEEGHSIEIDDDLIDSVLFYLNTVLEDEEPGDESWTEMPLTAALQKIDSDLGGTADRVRYRPSTKSLRVFDYKHGSGVYVDVRENEQELVYALGAMLELDKPIAEVILTIVQPRFEGAEPVRDYKFLPGEIIDFIERVQQAAIITRQPDAPLVAGDHCKFCPARAACPELEKHEHALVAQDFIDLPALAPEKLATALVSITLVKARIKAIEEYAYAEAQKGMQIPGWKLVDKIPRRHWKVSEDFLADKFGERIWAPREVRSPAQAEKVLSKEEKKLLFEYVESKSSGTVLVPAADDRPTAQHAITAGDFAALPAPSNPQLLGF